MKILNYICLGIVCCVCIILFVYNIFNNGDFLIAPLSSIITILVAGIISYGLVQKKTDDRRKKEKIDKLLYKIQDIILADDFLEVKKWDLQVQRSIANKIDFLEKNTKGDVHNCIVRIKDQFDSYRNYYGNHYTDAEHMKNSIQDRKNYIVIIDDVCDEIHIKLL